MPWTWNESSHRYHDSATGRFMSKAEVLGYVQNSLDSARTAPATTLTGGVNSAGTDLLSNLVGNGMMNPRDWHEMMREEIKREYIRQYLLGRGGQGSMTSKDWGSIGGMLKEQYRYLKDFAKLVQEGALSEGQIRARAAMYVNSAREGFERGQARSYGIPGGALPAHPGDGQTQCLTNCACSWEIEEVYEGDILTGWNCYWTLGIVKTEHCPDCLENTAKWNPLFITAGGEVVEGPTAPEVPPTPTETPPALLAGQVPTGEDVTTEKMNAWLTKGLGTTDWASATDEQRAEAKREIIAILSERTGIPQEDVNRFIEQWSHSSNDGDMRSLAIQKDAAEEFGLSVSQFTQEKINTLEREFARYQRIIEGKEELGAFEFVVPEEEIARPIFHSLLPEDDQRHLLRAMYDNTQEQLQEIGLDTGNTIRLWRGVRVEADYKKGDEIEVTGNTLESWSTSIKTASDFAQGEKGGIVLEMDVPVEMIMGSARTGFGCLTEGEFVLLGSQGRARIVEKF